MNTITTNATLYHDGYIAEHGVTVIDDGDIVIIGSTAHMKDDLESVYFDIGEIESGNGWSVSW